MYLKILITLFLINNITPQGLEITEQGKIQYQLLQERVKLPKYGSCWKQAIEHIETGCGALTENTQSDIALHLTNCFLEMSGHESYNCVLDKKQNLRGICISSMTDRAFHVYTEFYTHTQNMCWFLKGQVWQEAIADNTMRVGRQLESSARTQEQLLRNQRESLEMQEKLAKYGVAMESLLKDFLTATQQHQEILHVLSGSIASLRAWVIGEVSWIDTLVFYMFASVLIMFFTSNRRTASARIPIFMLLALNLLCERFICRIMASDIDIQVVHVSYYVYIWYLRYTFVTISAIVLALSVHFYKDYLVANNELLQKMYAKILDISENYNLSTEAKIDLSLNDFENTPKRLNDVENTPKRCNSVISSKSSVKRIHASTPKRNLAYIMEPEIRYNLRSRTGTPDVI